MFLHKNNDLPEELTDLTKFRNYLGTSEKELSYLQKFPTKHYTLKPIPKRSGGTRLLEIPNDRLKYILRKILRCLEEVYAPRQSVHGFTKGRGVISNAKCHIKRPFLLNIDLKDFFGTITKKRVSGVLVSVGIPSEVATTITELTVARDKLPQGAPTSPILANMVSFQLDIRLHRYAKENNMRYTRFADDMTFSSFVQPTKVFHDQKMKTGKLSEKDLSTSLRNVISGCGFKIHPSKIWFSDRKLRKQVTGLVVHQFPNIPRKFVRNLRATLHKILKNGYDDCQKEFVEKYKSKSELRNVVRGRIEWIGQIKGRSDPVFRTLADKYNHLFPKYQVTVEPTYEELIGKAIWVIEWGDYEPKSKSGQGTAFFLENVGLVTAHHVIEEMPKGSKAKVFLSNKIHEKYDAWISESFCDHVDVAKLNHNIPDNKFLELPVSLGGYSKRDSITIFGFPSYHIGNEISEIEATITSVSTISAVERISVTGILHQGISGGPALDTRSHVIGLVHKGGADYPRQLITSIHEIKKVCAQTTEQEP